MIHVQLTLINVQEGDKMIEWRKMFKNNTNFFIIDEIYQLTDGRNTANSKHHKYKKDHNGA